MADPVYTHIHQCAKHLRLTFWKHRIWEGYFTGKYNAKPKNPNPVNPPFPDRTGTIVRWTHELELREPLDGNRVALKAHWYFDEHFNPAGSGAPDPKFIRIGETKYHLWSPGNPPCIECSWLRRVWMHAQNMWDRIERIRARMKS